MDIQLAGAGPAKAASAPQSPPKRREIEPEQRGLADIYDGSRTAGNVVSGLVVGAATQTVAATAQSPLLAGKIVVNLWKAETLGPNLKTLGTLAALPLAGASIVAAPFYGAVQGATHAGDSGRSAGSPLVGDASPNVARELTGPRPNGEPRTMSGKMMQSLDELGARKLQPGEKPHDVPILSPAFAIVGGAASGVIGGSVGLVTGLVAGGIAGTKDIKSAFTSPDLSFGQRIGKVAASPLNLMVGPVLAWKSIKEAVPRGLEDGWKSGVIKPVVDTARISGTLGASVIHEAWEK